MNPTIFDDRGKEVPSVAGPYEEGREMKLLCMVSGGECPWLLLNFLLASVSLI
jgi:hypothetical protein